MKTLFVTGASGFLGWQVCRRRQRGWRVVGCYNSNREGIFPKTECLQADLTDKDQTWRAIREVKPSAVFHLAAFSDTNFCEKHPEQTRRLNIDAAADLAEMCAERNIRFVFTSSEQVFDGLRERYAETDLPAPRNSYGRQKLEAERQVLEILPEAAVARISVLFGKGSPAAGSFLENWLEAWGKFLPVAAFHDEHRSFLSGESAAEALFLLLEEGACGIFHVAGADALSRYEFAALAKHVFRIPNAVVTRLSQQEIKMPAFRPPKLALDSSKISGIGFEPRPARGELARLAKEMTLPPAALDN